MGPMRVYLTGSDGDAQAAVADWLRRRHGFARVALSGGPLDAQRMRGGDSVRAAALALEHGDRQASLVIDGVRTTAEAEYLRARGVLGVRVAARLLRSEQPDGLAGDAPEVDVATVPVDLVLLPFREPLAHDRDLRLLVARLAVLHATRAMAVRVPQSTRGVRQGR